MAQRRIKQPRWLATAVAAAWAPAGESKEKLAKAAQQPLAKLIT